MHQVCRVLGSILLDLALGRGGQVDAALIGEPDQIHEHVGHLFTQMLPLGLRPARQAGLHLALPLEALAKLAHLANPVPPQRHDAE